MSSYTHSCIVNAPRDVVFDVVADRLGYAEITSLQSVKLLRKGVDSDQGVGAVHKLSALGPIGAVEEVVAADRPHRFAYRVIGGMPVRDHVGTILLAEGPDGSTVFDYTMDSRPAIPLPDKVYRRILKASVLSLAVPMAAEAERRAALV